MFYFHTGLLTAQSQLLLCHLPSFSVLKKLAFWKLLRAFSCPLPLPAHPSMCPQPDYELAISVTLARTWHMNSLQPSEQLGGCVMCRGPGWLTVGEGGRGQQSRRASMSGCGMPSVLRGLDICRC